jgi:hypothetical protein
LLKYQWVIEAIREKMESLLEVNENENTIKGVVRGKIITMSAYIRRTERSQTNDLMLHLKLIEKQELKPKTSIRREIITIRAKINEIETKI